MIKADEAAKLIGDETGYRVYGLTQALGDAKGDRPKAVEDVCTDTLSVSLSHSRKARLLRKADAILGIDSQLWSPVRNYGVFQGGRNG